MKTLSIIEQIMTEEFPLQYAFCFDPEAPIKKGIWLAEDGLYESVKLPHFDMVYQTSKFKTRPAAGKLTPFVTPIPEMPKVPIEIVATIFAFFRQVYDKAKTEVQINVYWNRNHVEIPDVPGMKSWGNDIYTYVPKQKVSAARTTISNDDTYMYMVSNTTILLDTHSHHDMDAFMSGTDQSSSNIPAIYFDFGKITSVNAHIYAWAAIDENQIFENLPLSELYKFMEPLPEPKPIVPSTPMSIGDRFGSKTGKIGERPVTTSTQHTYPTYTPYQKPANAFSSEDLMLLAADIPEDWGKQIVTPPPTYPTYPNYTGYWPNRSGFQQNWPEFDGITNYDPAIDFGVNPAQSFDSALSNAKLSESEQYDDCYNMALELIQYGGPALAIIKTNVLASGIEPTTSFSIIEISDKVQTMAEARDESHPYTYDIYDIISPITGTSINFTGAITTFDDLSDEDWLMLKAISDFSLMASNLPNAYMTTLQVAVQELNMALNNSKDELWLNQMVCERQIIVTTELYNPHPQFNSSEYVQLQIKDIDPSEFTLWMTRTLAQNLGLILK